MYRFYSKSKLSSYKSFQAVVGILEIVTTTTKEGIEELENKKSWFLSDSNYVTSGDIIYFL